MNKISKKNLEKIYNVNKRSSAEIAKLLRCSEQGVNYWLKKYGIRKRSISEAIYLKHNPRGDPFKVIEPRTLGEAKLFGLGIGLYWGEGTKKSRNQVRLGNSDSELIKAFIKFLEKICGVSKSRLRFGLQVFSDTNPQEALVFWMKKLEVSRSQFYKVIITPSRGVGTYREKMHYGVLTVYFNNTKLRDIVYEMTKNITSS